MLDANNQKSVNFAFRSGLEAKDYSGMAKKENLKPLEVELKRLEDTVQAIHQEMVYLQQREQQMRTVNGKNNYIQIVCFVGATVLCFVCSLFCVIFLLFVDFSVL